MDSTPGGDAVKIVEATIKDVECYINLVDKAVTGSEGLTSILKEVLSYSKMWTNCYQTALHTKEKLFVKGVVD